MEKGCEYSYIWFVCVCLSDTLKLLALWILSKQLIKATKILGFFLITDLHKEQKRTKKKEIVLNGINLVIIIILSKWLYQLKKNLIFHLKMEI
jgi:hypothetical protein